MRLRPSQHWLPLLHRNRLQQRPLGRFIIKKGFTAHKTGIVCYLNCSTSHTRCGRRRPWFVAGRPVRTAVHPPAPVKAQQKPDEALDKAHALGGAKKSHNNGARRVACLFDLYQQYTSLLSAEKTKLRRRAKNLLYRLRAAPSRPFPDGGKEENEKSQGSLQAWKPNAAKACRLVKNPAWVRCNPLWVFEG